jgi:hypothetical protein
MERRLVSDRRVEGYLALNLSIVVDLYTFDPSVLCDRDPVLSTS